ncbi:hypothetical protein [Mesorhizobium sp. M1365]|uniref:hypothetical protein n=1 Tax=Mesorhizobium sp. M1365 TaxID=2957090 RepID=UPI003335424C
MFAKMLVLLCFIMCNVSIGNQANLWKADTMTNFKIVFFGKQGQTIEQRVVACESHWEACRWGWKHMPSKAHDFHAEEASFEEQLKTSEAEENETILKAFHILRKRAGLTRALPRKQ